MDLPWKKSKERSRKPRSGEDRGEGIRWVRVTIAPGQVAAGMLVGALDSEGIPHFEKKLGFDFPMMASNQVSIMVPEEYVDRATELLGGISDIQE
ncbi:MAG: putative signal transducing protein [Candidatus Geothermincolia bacterium]